ncbi:putative gamma-glutamylcyclotransferase At3g02910 [Amaranthus tricolor]|uniref:putative gamma-glutamylcyclotransferase At3g02910 n=1 Tax=Amaranthus tricolor TaxID=29722 RepID=UPI002589C0AB|nr:putative gamma-glutamylcyclotransferase At3g02910 [Amaranthus tricolor]
MNTIHIPSIPLYPKTFSKSNHHLQVKSSSPTKNPQILKNPMGAEKNSGNRLIFTYGTLKKGFSNHRLMEDLINTGDAFYIGSYRTTKKYPLVCGPYRVPFLLNIPGEGNRVWGEVYLVSGKALTRLDELEGTTRGHYERLPIEIADLPGDLGFDAVEAYYAGSSYANEMWKRNGENGFVCYSSKEATGYVKRADRPPNLSFLDHISVFLSSSPVHSV